MRSKNPFRSHKIISSLIAGLFLLAASPAAVVFGHINAYPGSTAGALVLSPIPFPGPEPKSLPATLEAENFDRGGEGISYHEVSGASGSGLYRNRPAEGVDIQAFSGASGGFVVTETAAGEWLTYTIFAAAAGSYELSIRYTSEFRGGTFHAEIDGQNITGAMIAAPTGANFRSFFKKADLTAGQHTLRLVMDSNSINPETGAASANVCNFDSIGFRALKYPLNGAAKENSYIFTYLREDRYSFALASLTSALPVLDSLRLQQ